ncbi:hypothetical protein CKO28_04845 [Rhodovibrio sodomensis]|uniref:DNA methylase adenine-specific domain-containing protein n=1 Tax=Rhodovibrio sodomensis TaxID=1088 RepID=A0ABS1DBQ6_9PROT|nr:N-6 DNA methylase [Rhodovibrio sodomensis]MBK1667356.1 hypothetical protein [Rhodovibrio sodomensis]
MAKPLHSRLHCPHLKDFCRTLSALPGHRNIRDHYCDFLEASLASLHSVSLKLAGRDPTPMDRAYAGVRQRAGAAVMQAYAQMFSHLASSLEARPRDAFGELFGALDLGVGEAGQFYTPFEVSQFLVQANLTDIESVIAEKGFFTVAEPAVGAGGMLIAVRNEMVARGLSPHRQCLAVGVDIDRRAVAMAYIQTTLLGLATVVVHGDALKLDLQAEYPNIFAQKFVTRGFDTRDALGGLTRPGG